MLSISKLIIKFFTIVCKHFMEDTTLKNAFGFFHRGEKHARICSSENLMTLVFVENTLIGLKRAFI